MAPPQRGLAPEEIDWTRLDKQKFFFVGAALFSGLTTLLFPLSVIKTRQMALEGAPTGLRGAGIVAKQLVQSEGVLGLYRGFGMVILGIIPIRAVYLTNLEVMKSATYGTAYRIMGTEAGASGVSNFIGGAFGSLVSQFVAVPIDVISQRLMVAGGKTASGVHQGAALPAGGSTGAGAPLPRSALGIANHIVRTEGIRGLYRGIGISMATFVPGSGIWWGAYGTYQKLLWEQLDWLEGGHGRAALRKGQERPHSHTSGQVLGVQTAAGALAGMTSTVLTTPLDVVKTRLQVADRKEGGQRPTVRSVARQLVAEDGPRGFFRGLLPRMANVVLWGTCMVNAYEFLKRFCVLPEPPPPRLDQS
eukprot:jgi/Botrbrau1/7875/Bobra.9_2s0051.1